MHPYLLKMFENKQVVDQSGNIHYIKDHISIEEGLFVQEIIREIKPDISLEIGLATGVSAMFICETLKELGNSRHIVIDPGQNNKTEYDDWQGIGLYNLAQCKYDDIVTLLDEPSEISLPKLLKQNLKVNFAFIDGWHTFDHALLDFFYINRMLAVGGVVVFDDAHFPSINKAINYISNYPAYEPYVPGNQSDSKRSQDINPLISFYNAGVNRVKSIVSKLLFNKIFETIANDKITKRYYAFKKISEDRRSWDWFENF